MSNIRQWRVSSTLGGGVQTVTLAASTWGELKRGLEQSGIKVSGMKVTIKTNDGFVSNSDDAYLPTDATMIAITPEGTKNGSN